MTAKRKLLDGAILVGELLLRPYRLNDRRGAVLTDFGTWWGHAWRRIDTEGTDRQRTGGR